MNKQSYIYISTCTVLLFLWFFLLFTPYQKEKDSIELKISENNSQLHDFELTINTLPQFITERKALRKKRKHINSNLFTKEEVINLFSNLKETAAKQNLTVTEITPPIEELLHLNSFIPDSTKPQFLNIGVNVSGSYIEFAQFIKLIEKQPYFRGINTCRIYGSKDMNKKLDLYIGFKALLGRIGDQS